MRLLPCSYTASPLAAWLALVYICLARDHYTVEQPSKQTRRNRPSSHRGDDQLLPRTGTVLRNRAAY